MRGSDDCEKAVRRPASSGTFYRRKCLSVLCAKYAYITHEAEPAWPCEPRPKALGVASIEAARAAVIPSRAAVAARNALQHMYRPV